jgi:hypothetical protein
MTDRKPLWASSLADQPQSAHDDVIVRVLEDEPDEAPLESPRPVPQPSGRRRLLDADAVLPAALAAVCIAMPGLVLQGPGSLTIKTVPSSWGDVPMKCHTVRVDAGERGRALERFRCRAVDDLPLPPGLYLSPESQWFSDITSRSSRESRVRITPDGEVTGTATY